jgi:putative ABC transport system permease protein
MKKLLLKNWRDILDRKAQFGALIVLVALGISSYVSFISGYLNLSSSTDYAYERLRFADFSISVWSAPKTVLERIRAIRGVKAVEGRLIVDTGIYISDEQQAQARVISIPTGHRPSVNDLLIEKGSYLQGEAKETCLIDSQYAKERGVNPGDTIKPFFDGSKKEITVKGVVTSPEYFISIADKSSLPSPGEFVVIFMAQQEVERLFKKRSSYNDIAVLLDESADREKIISQVEKVLDPYLVINTVKKEDQPSNFSLQGEIEENRSFAYLMPFIILFIATLSLFIALTRLVQSQRGEIGLAKALGYSNWQILLHYLVFSLFIAIVGSAFGFLLGDFFAREILKLYIPLFGIPYLRHEIHLQTLIGSVSMSSITCVLAGIVPAYVSARMPPALAMRADPNITLAKGRTPLVEKALAALFPVPLAFRIPLRNVFRAQRRSLYTIIGISFALLMTLATWASFDSMDFLFDHQFNQVEKWDILAGFSQNFSASRVNQVKSWDGVRKVQPALAIPAELKANGHKHETAITAIEPGASFHGFDITIGLRARYALEMRGVILTPLIAKKLGVDVGDALIVESPYIKDRELEFKVLALSDEMVGAPVFISKEQGRRILRSPGYLNNSLYLDVDPREATKIKKKLYELPGATVVIVKQKMIDSLEEMMEFTNVFFGVLLAFAFTMAFVVVYNTFTTNILERLREIATMRTIGEDRWHLALMITLENMILAMAGVPLGLWLGQRTTIELFKSFSSEAYTMRAVIYTATYFWVVACILVVLLLSEIPPIRRIFRLDLAEATKILE